MQTSLIYNVTVKVDNSIAADWLRWLNEEHVPQILATGCFQEARISRLLDVDDSEGPTYVIQYGAASKADYNRYLELHAADMRQISYDLWGEGFIAFRSLLEVLHHM